MDTIPGDLLGTTQDYKAGANTFTEQDTIFALVSGNSKIDTQADIIPSITIPKLLSRGDIVYARIEDMFDPIILLKVEAIENNGKRQAVGDTSAVIHVSNLKDGFVEFVHNEMHIGDIVKAKVMDVKPHGIYLTTKERDLGVISAYCERCRSSMYIENGTLICKRCRHREYRKLGYPYKVI